jgi:hypothetical protein
LTSASTTGFICASDIFITTGFSLVAFTRPLVGQRVFGLALGYEDLNGHDELRHDPVMAVLAGKMAAGRKDCAPVAGKSTLTAARRWHWSAASRA